MTVTNELFVKTRKEWRDWLEKNHAIFNEIWLVYYKKHTGKPRIPYDDAVEEALCFGWIDSIVKRLDEERFCQKFTPRNDRSQWSELNKQRAEKMIEQGLMTEAGLFKVRVAKKSGEWDKKPSQNITSKMPREFKKALKSNKKASENFENLSPSYRKQYIGWIASAKRPETRERRILEVISHLEMNRKPGLK